MPPPSRTRRPSATPARTTGAAPHTPGPARARRAPPPPARAPPRAPPPRRAPPLPLVGGVARPQHARHAVVRRGERPHQPPQDVGGVLHRVAAEPRLAEVPE